MDISITDAERYLRAHGAPEGDIFVGVIAGSGLSGLASHLQEPRAVPYAEIPGWPIGAVAGHAGEFVFGCVGRTDIGLASGRVHLYEGKTPSDLIFGVRVLARLGVRTLIVTNAAGALDHAMTPGDVMVIRDHIAFPPLAGLSPLVGDNEESLGPRFPGMVGAYDPALAALALEAARAAGFTAHHGVYAMVGGPSFETPAEARMLRALGADAVGMSTAPEVIAARHMGLRVVGLSLITNLVVLDDRAPKPADDLHADVIAQGAAAAERLARVIVDVVEAASDGD